MPTKPTPKTDLDIEQLKKRHKELEEKKITAEANLNNASKLLDELKRQAKTKYNTDDPAQLQKMLQEMKADNERKRAEYQQHLEDIQAKLAQVERDFDAKPQ
jgi:cell division septum initiation protein DivIVA